MGRNKHQRAEHTVGELTNSEKYKRIFEHERRNREAWESLTHLQQLTAWNAENARQSPTSRAIANTTECQMPGCDKGTISLAGRSLGICYLHAIDIGTYWDIHGEDFQMMVDRVERHEAAARADRLEQRKAESRRISPGWIYYILLNDRIKIGYSIDVKRRLTAYPFDTPLLAMHPGTKQLESEMHAKFAGCRVAGREYFLDTPELREHIKEVIEQFGEPDRARYERRGRMHSTMRASAPKPTGISR